MLLLENYRLHSSEILVTLHDMRRLYLIPLVLMLNSFQESFATVRMVPAQYPSILYALFVAAPHDTILLESGIYVDSVRITRPITIASNFLFTNDTANITTTVWRSIYARSAAYLDSCAVRFIGIAFQSDGEPIVGKCAINGISFQLQLDRCHFVGTFDSVPSLSRSVINAQGRTRIIANDCRVYGDTIGMVPWIWFRNTSWFSVNRCLFLDRSNNARLVMDGYADSAQFVDCLFRNRGSGIQLSCNYWFWFENCSFIGNGNSTLNLSNTQRQSQISNCVFDSLHSYSTGLFSKFIWLGGVSNPYPPRIVNTSFSNFTQTNFHDDPLIAFETSQNPIEFDQCRFTGNNFAQGELIQNQWTSPLENCVFIDNNTPVGLFRGDNNSRTALIRNCDLVNNIIQGTGRNIDSVLAPNCWWGDSTGPHWVGNPSGSGQSLPNAFNPVPWRLTSVFPSSSVHETIFTQSLPSSIELLAYPNPFNGEVTIRYSLPNPNASYRITIVDITGRTVYQSCSSVVNRNQLHWNATQLSSGNYFVQISSGNQSQVARVTLQK